MANRKLPFASALLGMFACLVMLLPQSTHIELYFDHAQFSAGSYLGVVFGHWVHADWEHLGWNVLALLVLGSIIEFRSRRLLFTAIVVGMLFVNLLLFSPLGTVQRYCGLSGVLNTLLGVVLICYWKETHSRLIPFLGLICIIKIIVELYIGSSVLTHVSWPPFTMAHVAGLLGTPLAWYFGSECLGVKSCQCNGKMPPLNCTYSNGIR